MQTQHNVIDLTQARRVNHFFAITALLTFSLSVAGTDALTQFDSHQFGLEMPTLHTVLAMQPHTPPPALGLDTLHQEELEEIPAGLIADRDTARDHDPRVRPMR